MSIEGAIVGLIMMLQPVEQAEVGHKLYQGLIYSGRIIQKTNEGTWGASMHEESHQITKDTIYKMGGIK